MALTPVSGAVVAAPATLEVVIQIGGLSKPMILGLLAVLVLPMITILFVSYLVDVETLDEERLERIEDAVLEIQEELGLDEDDDEEPSHGSVVADGEGVDDPGSDAGDETDADVGSDTDGSGADEN